MLKGLIEFNGGKIPFVVENYRMELFSDDHNLISDFAKEHNLKEDYILHGLCFRIDGQEETVTFFVEYSMGDTCYLRCYIINFGAVNSTYDTIGFQSPFLDDVFQYKYKYIDMTREGINLGLTPQNLYTIPFVMKDRHYELKYFIGKNHCLGLDEDFDKKGEFLVDLQTDDIRECYDITTILYRLTMFMQSKADVPFQKITLYKNGEKMGCFLCSMVSEKVASWSEVLFYQFDIMKYIPKILNNIALDSGNSITQSIPLGHLGDFDTLFSPARFLQQVMSFEYLFDKLQPSKAKNSTFPLKAELKSMFDAFPELLTKPRSSSEEISEKTKDEICEEIKELRRKIAHGHVYYYDFKNDFRVHRLIIILDRLIKSMSLQLAGFSKAEIDEYPV